jgi:hypothetical protein
MKRAALLALAAAVVASAPLGAQQPPSSGGRQSFPEIPQTVPGVPQVSSRVPQAAPGMPQAMPVPVMPGVPAEYQQMIAQMQVARSSAQRPGDESLGCEALKVEIEAAMKVATSVGVDTGDGLVAPEAVQPPSMQPQQFEYGAMLPHLARSQRLTELAVIKNCAWLSSAGFPTGVDAGLDQAAPAPRSPD